MGKFALIILALLFIYPSYSQKLIYSTTTRQSKPFVFMENKGQLADQEGKVLHDIRYYARSNNGVNIYCEKDRIGFVFSKGLPLSPKGGRYDHHFSKSILGTSINQPFTKSQNDKNTTKQKSPLGDLGVEASRMEMQFLNANPDAQTISEEPNEYYENYYLAHCPDGITAHGFKKIIYKNIYSQIDLVLSCLDQKMEYSFIVNPGGNVSDIKIKWNGADSFLGVGDPGHLHLTNKLGYLDESGLKAFDETGTQVNSNYLFDRDITSFNVAEYDKGKVLTIDPTLIWATYFGGNGYDYPSSMASDTFGNILITGSTASINNIATAGAYLTSLPASADAFIAKFNNEGKLLWSTYFGGLKGDWGSGICTNDSGQIFITVYASSSGLATSGAWQTVSNTILIARFSGAGSLIWSTYYGKVGGKATNICSDINGNIYITGFSDGTNIATSGAYQTSPAGHSDAFLAKFDKYGKLVWGTYYGGYWVEEGYGVCTDRTGNVFITGTTMSTNGIATSGTYQTSLNNYPYNDAYLAKFSSDGKFLWGTYFGGISEDRGIKVKSDNNNNVFICGYTTSNRDISTANSWQKIYGGGGSDGFLAKFNSNGLIQWSTYFGDAEGDDISDLNCDTWGNVYITGWTFSTKNIATSGAYQKNFGGNEDAFLAKFNNSGNLIYSTYYGGSNYDYGVGVCADHFGNVFLLGNTLDTSGIATSGAYQTSYGGSTDAFIAKFGNVLKTDAGIRTIVKPTGEYCQNFNSQVVVKLTNYGKAELDSVQINWAVNGTVQKSYEWHGKLKPDSSTDIIPGSYFFTLGNDTIKSWTSKPNGIIDSFPLNDTAWYFLYNGPPHPNTGGSRKICPGSKVQIGTGLIPGHKYKWTSNPAGFTDTTALPTVSPTRITTYYLTETGTTGCTGSDSATITFYPLPVVKTGGNLSVCTNNTVTLGDSAVPGISYLWSSNPDFYKSTISNPTFKAYRSSIYYLTETITATGCSNMDSAVVTVNNPPNANAGSDRTVCQFSKLQLGGSYQPENSYSWKSNPPGFSADTSNPVIYPKKDAAYILTVKLIGTNCTSTDSVYIKVNPKPATRVGGGIICKGDSILIGYPGPKSDIYSWISFPSGISSTAANVEVRPAKTTKYILNELNPATQCSNTDTGIVTVNPLPNPSIYGNPKLCGIISSNYTTKNDSGANYNWSIHTGKIISGQGTNKVNLEPDLGYDSISVLETDANGCKNTAVFKVMVNGLPDARWKLVSDSPVSVFKALDSFEQYFHWDFGDGATGSSYLEHHRYSFIKDTFVKVSLTVATAFGCTSTFDSVIKIRYIKPETFSIQVFPNPFNQFTTIKIDLDKAARIRIFAYDAIGRYIGKIIDANQTIGTTLYPFVSDKYQLASGVYFLKILVDEKVFVFPVIRVN
jgi:hypothetical protein